MLCQSKLPCTIEDLLVDIYFHVEKSAKQQKECPVAHWHKCILMAYNCRRFDFKVLGKALSNVGVFNDFVKNAEWCPDT